MKFLWLTGDLSHLVTVFVARCNDDETTLLTTFKVMETILFKSLSTYKPCDDYNF